MKPFLAFVFIVVCFACTAQNVQWVRTGGGVSFDQGWNVCVDAGGNAYVAGFWRAPGNFSGYAPPSFGLADGFLAKYNAFGALSWVITFGGISHDFARGICIDNNGDIIVVGTFTFTATFGSFGLISAGADDVFIAKFNPSGNCLWAISGGNNQSYDDIRDVTTDAANDIYISGILGGGTVFGPYTAPPGSPVDMVCKISPSGIIQWGTTTCQNTSGASYPQKLALDAGGNIYTTGYFLNTCIFGGLAQTSAGSFDAYYQELDPAGNIQWTNFIGTASDEKSMDLALDSSGNIFICGTFYGSTNIGGIPLLSVGTTDMFVAKSNTNGNIQWAKSFGGTTADYSNAIELNSTGDIVIGGSFISSIQFGGTTLSGVGLIPNAFVALLSSAGIPVWAIQMSGNSNNYTYGVATFPGGIYCTGIIHGTASFNGINATSAGGSDFYLAKIGNGVLLPVEMISFTASPDGKNVNCLWETASEKNCAYFLLEKSADFAGWIPVAKIQSHHSSSTTAEYYIFTDHAPFPEINYYRLTSVDLDGKVSQPWFSSVNFIADFSFDFYPNPASGMISISLSQGDGPSEIYLTDLMGSRVGSSKIFVDNQETKFPIEAADGIYFLHLKNASGDRCRKIIVKR